MRIKAVVYILIIVFAGYLVYLTLAKNLTMTGIYHKLTDRVTTGKGFGGFGGGGNGGAYAGGGGHAGGGGGSKIK